MTEKEKCAAGLLYDANYDKELIRERMTCKDLCVPEIQSIKEFGYSEKK